MKKKEGYTSLLQNMTVEWKWIFSYAKKYKFALVLYIFLGVVATVMSLGVTVASRYLIDSVSSKYLINTVVGNVSENILVYALITIGLVVFQHVFQSLSSYVTAVVSSRTNKEIRENIYSHIVKAQWEEISPFHSGDILNRLESDTQTVSNAIISFIPNLITRSVQFFGALAIVLYYDKTMALIALMSAPLMFFSSRFFIKTIRKFSKQSRELNGKVLSFSEESVQNLLTIKAFDLTKEYIKKFGIVLEEHRKVKLSYERFSILMTLFLSLAGVIVSYGCYGWGVYQLWKGQCSFGQMTMFIQLSGQLTASFGALAALVPLAVSTATSAGRVMELTDLPDERDADREKVDEFYEKVKDSGVSIVLDNVSFKYKNGEGNVIEKASFKINPGEIVAFVGPSGEGKTTLLKLLLGIMPVTEGGLFIEAADGEKIKISDSTRRFCSYVPQGINIFSGTIRENLTMAKSNVTEEDLCSVIRATHIDGLIQSLPEGLDTVINERGGNFSQGQLQRMAIARALIKDSEILIMDEATSALDADTESKVLQEIMVSNPMKICIITTHRASMLEYCDRVFRVEQDGGISEVFDHKS